MKNDSSNFNKVRFGDYPDNESGFRHKMRLHQGWWRCNVLAQEAGIYPGREDKTLCSSIKNGKVTGVNFLTDSTSEIVAKTLQKRGGECKGMIQEERLYNNLLSSQPLCFNFFAEFEADKEFGLFVLKTLYPNLTRLREVKFEFAPEENYSGDNSAFDVAFEVEENEKVGLIGWEVKYTDTFSTKEYDRDEYKQIHGQSAAFKAPYDTLKQSRVNQLFRNQLIAEGLLRQSEYGFVYTGLFCHQDDKSAIKTAEYFKTLLNDEVADFRIITYSKLIENMQKLDLSWEQREWTMMLWARYCGLCLSNSTTSQIL